MSDTNAALHGLVAVLAAIHLRQRTGLGGDLEMAVLGATLALGGVLLFELENSEATKVLPSLVWETAAGPVLISADMRHVWRQLSAYAGIADPGLGGMSIEEKSERRKEAIREYLRALPDRATVMRRWTGKPRWGDVRDGAECSSDHRAAPRRHRHDRRPRGNPRPFVRSPYRFFGGIWTRRVRHGGVNTTASAAGMARAR